MLSSSQPPDAGDLVPHKEGAPESAVKAWHVLLSPQDTWMMMDYHTDSALSPTPPQTDLRATLCMEKRMAVGSSSSLTAGSPLCSA